jgi:hypothetical protein
MKLLDLRVLFLCSLAACGVSDGTTSAGAMMSDPLMPVLSEEEERRDLANAAQSYDELCRLHVVRHTGTHTQLHACSHALTSNHPIAWPLPFF